MKYYLVLSALGENIPQLANQFTLTVKDSGCNILNSRMSVLGNEISMIMMLSGTWDAVAKIETMLPKLQKQLNISITANRTELPETKDSLMPYAIDIVAYDQIGIVHDITKFMDENNIGIQDMFTNTYKAANTGTSMFSLHMTVNIPTDISIASIRGDFIEFCDQKNFDAIMEPIK